jgi:hypothetical protein
VGQRLRRDGRISIVFLALTLALTLARETHATVVPAAMTLPFASESVFVYMSIVH